MRVVYVDGERVKEDSYSRGGAVKTMHKLAEQYFSGMRKLSIDMDGVLIHDDNAIMAARIVSGADAHEMYDEYAGLNIKAVSEGQVSYCWYAPTLFVGQLLQGLSPEINRVVGQNMRLIPGARKFIKHVSEGLGYDIAAVTAGHQEAAEEVSLRLGIGKTIGTQLGLSNGAYDGTVRRFIGGKHKLRFVRGFLNDSGTHIGDSYSDVETLEAIKNSLAFNPGCEPALRNADLSVIGVSLFGLLPFFDYKTRYDRIIDGNDLPRTLVVMQGPNKKVLEKLLKESRQIKKNELELILSQREFPRTEVESRIRARLNELGIDFRTKLKSFMPLEEFDRCAKEAYARLGKNGESN